MSYTKELRHFKEKPVHVACPVCAYRADQKTAVTDRPANFFISTGLGLAIVNMRFLGKHQEYTFQTWKNYSTKRLRLVL
ncbi:hypothetical protein Pcaca04_29190 [Pectobacterium carotovorum subsp. carotovorum]|nr:hypothetical protein Pcaca04_29190 [Pectobacterium carotovorum subsp. carotovorum]